ncbi:MAG: DUF4838 domain-containing protein, partial [Armatimonadota bacterium]
MSTSTTIPTLCALALLAAMAEAADQVEFVLARNGRPSAAILLAETPSVSAEFAAAEFQHHIQKITGARLSIVHEPAAVNGPRVLVGESAATRELGLRSADFADQEYMIRFRPDALILIGRDDSPSEAVDETQPTWVDGKFGKALGFDGVDDAITASDCGFDDERGSMECWVRLSREPQPREGTLLRLDGRAPWTYHILRRIAHTNRVGYFTYDGEKVRGVSSGELTEGWHHVLTTHDSAAGTAELFVDGASQGTMEYEKTTCKGAALNVGGYRHGSGVGNSLRGALDEIRVSEVVRSAGADAAGGPYTQDAQTTFLAHLDEGRGRPHLGGGFPGGYRMPDFFDANGTLYAVYDFLERYCDVRWYAPGDIGTVVPSAPTLVVGGSEVRRRPAMRHRWITPTPLYMPTSEDVLPAAEVNLWKLRMRIGGEAFWTCHSFGGYYDRFSEGHPEYFAKGYSGRPPQMCYTEAGLIAQVVQDARDYFDGKGSKPGSTNRGPYFGVVPQDNSNYCKCPRCQAEMDLSDAGNQQFSRGIASNYVWGFVNEVAKQVRETHPDKWIAALAYAR